MKRDMEVIRDILLEADSLPVDGREWVDTFGDPIKEYHLVLCHEAGLLDYNRRITDEAGHPCRVEGLTWEGREFADLARDDSIWHEAAERILSGVGSAPFDVWKWLLREIQQRRIS